jgi:GAF domain
VFQRSEAHAPTGDVNVAGTARTQELTPLADRSDDGGYRLKPDEVTEIVAGYGPIPKRRVGEQGRNLVRGPVPGRAMLERRTIHVHDIQSQAGADFPFSQGLQRELGVQTRTMLATPLLREGDSIGAILIRRTEPRPFTDKTDRDSSRSW